MAQVLDMVHSVAMMAVWMVAVVVGTAQANIVYQEDFERTLDADPTVEDFGYTKNQANILTTAIPVGLGGSGNQGALKPGGSAANWIHAITTPFPVATPATDVVRLSFDANVTDAYSGEGYVGLSNGNCCNEVGIFVGMTSGGWLLDLGGLGGPAGPFYAENAGIASSGQEIQVSVRVDITGTGGFNGEGQILVDVFNAGTTTNLFPQYTHDLTASQKGNLSSLDNVAIQYAGSSPGINGFDNIVLDVGPPFGGATSTFTWNLPGLGNWNSANSWNPGGIPNGDRDAIFGASITAPSTVSTDLDVTVRSIQFNNSHGYAIAGQGSVNLVDTTNPIAAIDVDQGTHQFQAVVNLHSPTVVTVASNSQLDFNNALNLGGNVLTKTGAGTLAINNVLTAGGGMLNCSQGVCSGSGTIGGDVINDGGTISPGNTSGAISVNGSVVPEPTGWALLVMGFLVLVGVNVRAKQPSAITGN